MSDTNKNLMLHLPSLEISGFRGIDSLSIPRLGHVTLLAGRNGVGKTTVLEAIRVYAARARPSIFQELLSRRGEYEYSKEEEQNRFEQIFEYENLFYGRNVNILSKISIDPGRGEDILHITTYPWSRQLEENQEGRILQIDNMVIAEKADLQFLRVTFRGKELILPSISTNIHNSPARWMHGHDESGWPSAMKCVTLGPGLPNKDEVAKYWEEVALTDDEGYCLESLQLMLSESNHLEGVTTIGDRFNARRVVVKLKGNSRRLPLASFGDGATRMFGVALSLANSRDGFLVIDEAENGVHHSLQENYWYMILESALRRNIQVFATTHSWDCVRGFARAAARSDAEGVLLRLEQEEDGKIGVVEYSEEGLGIVTKHGIEVR